ncbi:3-hydroxyacyl-CoA dehydrogenase, partial [Campylobacter coli]|nr:3-hydroxyacyl-CoA dehydrogenase [Campylobacter coli]
SLNEDLNLKKKSCKFLEIIIIVFRIQVL